MTTPAKNPGAIEQTDPLPLPGLVAAGPGAPELEVAARRTLTALAELELLGEQHALIAAGILSLSRTMSSAERKGQAAASAMAFAQILAAFQVLIPVVEGGDTDAYDQLAADLRAAAVDSARSAAEVRDSS